MEKPSACTSAHVCSSVAHRTIISKEALDAGHFAIIGETTRDSIQFTAHPPAHDPTREIIEGAGGSLGSPLYCFHVQAGTSEPHTIQSTIPCKPIPVTGDGLLQ